MVTVSALIGSDGYLVAMGVLLLTCLIELVRRLTNPAWRRTHLVSHRKLRATNLLHPQDAVPEVALGSTAPSGEPQPAPGTQIPSAGTTLQSGLSRLDQGRRRDPSSERPNPASETIHSGAGPTPPRARLAARHEEPQPPVDPVDGHRPRHLPQVDREGIPAGGSAPHAPPAGPTTRVTAAPTPLAGAVGDPDRDVDTLSRTPVSASPTKRPAIVADTPESTAVAGLPAHSWSTAVADLPSRPGAVRGSDPSVVAADGSVRSVA